MDGYTDLLDEIKAQGGLLVWITQKKNFIENSKPGAKRMPEQLKQQVLQSARLKHVIDQIVSKQQVVQSGAAVTEVKREDVEKEAKKILDEMAHQFDLKYVRFLGYCLMKVFARIFKHIYYNSDIESNLQVLKQYPVVLLPLHRSYMDFLLVSIVCFHKNIQLPGVAAGQDFLGLSFLSRFIRHSGGFFIRRSFGSDELYWAIFHEYVQEHLLNCDRPLEFFIEGTRSRTSKSLPPKFGMIASCIELYTKLHRVEDIYFVPISLTYEKLLEEMLYSNELLGIPKPKESVSSLVKARTILNKNYGSIFVNFARPVSLREMLYYIEGPVNIQNSIAAHTLTPSFIFEMNKTQMKSVELVSYTMLIEMLKNQVIQPISIISTCLLMTGASNRTSLHSLCVRIEKLKRILLNLGARVYWPMMKDLIELLFTKKRTAKSFTLNDDEYTRSKLIILENLETHSNLFDLEYQGNADYSSCLTLAKTSIVSSNGSTNTEFNNHSLLVKLKQSDTSNTQDNLFSNASNYIAFCSYRNQLVSFLIRISLVSYSLLASSINSLQNDGDLLADFDMSRAFDMFKFLLKLFNKEFIFKPGSEKNDFVDSLNYLTHTNILSKNAAKNEWQLVKLNLKHLFVYVKMFEYIIQDYVGVYDSVLSMIGSRPTLSFQDEKKFTQEVQKSAFDKLLKSSDSVSFDMEILSLNLLTNSLLTLTQFGALNRQNVNSNKEYTIKRGELDSVHRTLKFILATVQIKLDMMNKLVSDLSCEFEFDFSKDQIEARRSFVLTNQSSVAFTSRL